MSISNIILHLKRKRLDVINYLILRQDERSYNPLMTYFDSWCVAGLYFATYEIHFRPTNTVSSKATKISIDYIKYLESKKNLLKLLFWPPSNTWKKFDFITQKWTFVLPPTLRQKLFILDKSCIFFKSIPCGIILTTFFAHPIAWNHRKLNQCIKKRKVVYVLWANVPIK